MSSTSNMTAAQVSSLLGSSRDESQSQKRVRLAVNGTQELPGYSTEVDSDAPKRPRGRQRTLTAEEAAKRRRERNRAAAAKSRQSAASELSEARERAATLEREVEALTGRLGSLQRYVYDLEALLRSHSVTLPPRSPILAPTRRLAPSDSFNTDATEVTSRSSPEPERPRPRTPRRKHTPADEFYVPLERSPRYSLQSAVSYLRDTEAFPPAAPIASTSAIAPMAQSPFTPLPPTPATLEALQLQLKIQEQLAAAQSSLAQQAANLTPMSIPHSTPAEFTGGDDYDTMSLSAFFNLDALDDDPNDANFEPTSPKQDSSDDESEFEEEQEPPRKRARTASRSPQDEDEDLFLPIEDVPVPPPRDSADDLYAETMQSLGVSSREEFSKVVTRLFTDANRGNVTPEQMETLKRLMKIIEVRGLRGV